VATSCKPAGSKAPQLDTVSREAACFFSNQAARSAFDAFGKSFESAIAQRSPTVDTYSIAGHPVRLRIAGERLAHVLATAFVHLRNDSAAGCKTGLSVDLWDREATGSSAPDLPPGVTGQERWPGTSTVRCSHDRRFVLVEQAGGAVWLDRTARRVVGSFPSARNLSQYQRGKPLLDPLSIWLADEGIQMVHAAFVAYRGKGALFPGTGGSGKSTTSICCALAGFEYMGDDYIGVDAAEDGGFVGHSLYTTAWLDSDHAERFPELQCHLVRGVLHGEEKPFAQLSQVPGARFSAAAPIRALILPRVADAERTSTRPASSADALLRIAPSSLLQRTPPPGHDGFERLVKLVESAPAYWLDLGRDLSSIAGCVSRLMDELDG
jgi:hypothetical protein